jgi:hypothetical protein
MKNEMFEPAFKRGDEVIYGGETGIIDNVYFRAKVLLKSPVPFVEVPEGRSFGHDSFFYDVMLVDKEEKSKRIPQNRLELICTSE